MQINYSLKAARVSLIPVCLLSVLSFDSRRLAAAAPPALSAQEVRNPRYPSHWWTPARAEGKPDWEILPQEAGPGEEIGRRNRRSTKGHETTRTGDPFRAVFV